MATMAVEAKKLDVKIGDVVEIDGRRYDVVPDRAGGVTLEPAITVFAEELHERRGTRPLTDQEFDELSVTCPPTAGAERWPRRANKRLGGRTRRR
jgi:hypothetical protein